MARILNNTQSAFRMLIRNWILHTSNLAQPFVPSSIHRWSIVDCCAIFYFMVESLIDSYLYSPILSCLSFSQIGTISSVLLLHFTGILRNRAASRQPCAAPQDSPTSKCEGFCCQNQLLSVIRLLFSQDLNCYILHNLWLMSCIIQTWEQSFTNN